MSCRCLDLLHSSICNPVIEGWQGRWQVAFFENTVAPGEANATSTPKRRGRGRGVGTETDDSLSLEERRDVKITEASCKRRGTGEGLCKTAVGRKPVQVTAGKRPWCLALSL